MKVTVVGPNLPSQARATFHVHAAGCADLKRGWIKRYATGAAAWDMDAEYLTDVEASVYDFAPAEHDDYKLGDYLSEFYFAPCVDLPEKPEPVVDYTNDDLSFSIHVRQERDTFTAYIYLGLELVFTYAEPCSRTPEGINDFAGVAKKRFAQRLAQVMQP